MLTARIVISDKAERDIRRVRRAIEINADRGDDRGFQENCDAMFRFEHCVSSEVL